MLRQLLQLFPSSKPVILILGLIVINPASCGFVISIKSSVLSVSHPKESSSLLSAPRKLGTSLQMNMEAAANTGPCWDAENGVWVGEKAAGHEEADLPNPLWIFGYGSLCWRPEESFTSFERRPGSISGWARLFAQRSMDHRGTPSAPGLVVTIVSDEDLNALNYRTADQQASITHGVAYCIPQDKAREVLADLDYREKGGYMRAVVDVTFTDGSGKASALLYTGAVDNPNFYLPASLDEAAEIIANAHGPSGPNKEYLFNLSEYLRVANVEDQHVFDLDCKVKHILENNMISNQS